MSLNSALQELEELKESKIIADMETEKKINELEE